MDLCYENREDKWTGYDEKERLDRLFRDIGLAIVVSMVWFI